MYLLKKEDLEINLIIVGSGPQELDLKKQVDNLNLSNEVIFTGQKKYLELKEYYKSADIYILPWS